MAHRRNPAREKKRCLEILGLSDGATDEEIKKSYKKMALKFHPDKNKNEDAKEKFQEVNYAYKYLTEGPEAVGLRPDMDVGQFEQGAAFDILLRLFPWLFGDTGRPSQFSFFTSGPTFGSAVFTPFGFSTHPFGHSFSDPFAEPDDTFPFFREEDPFHPRSSGGFCHYHHGQFRHQDPFGHDMFQLHTNRNMPSNISRSRQHRRTQQNQRFNNNRDRKPNVSSRPQYFHNRNGHYDREKPENISASNSAEFRNEASHFSNTSSENRKSKDTFIEISDEEQTSEKPKFLNKKQRRKQRREEEQQEHKERVNRCENEEEDLGDRNQTSYVDSDDKDSMDTSEMRNRSDRQGKSSAHRHPDFREFYDNDVPETLEDEEEMLQIAIELSKSELLKDKNNAEKKGQKKGGNKSFSVTVSADCGGTSSNLSEFRQKDCDEFSTYDNCEDWDTESWYDNIGGLSDLPSDHNYWSPMAEVQKTYYKNIHVKDPSKCNYYDNSGRSKSSDLNDIDEIDNVDLNLDGSRSRFDAENLENPLHKESLHIPRGIKTEQMKGMYRKH